MDAKLHIDVSQGIVSIEGDVEFVREVYADFKDNLERLRVLDGGDQAIVSRQSKTKSLPSKSKQSGAARKPSRRAVEKLSVDPKNPQLDKSLDTSGLREYFEQFKPKNQPERILIFAKFLIEEKEMQSINTDHIYTCYSTSKAKIPEAFAQSFRHAQGRRHGYIEFDSFSDLKITTLGENHFNQVIAREDGIEREWR